MAQMPDLLDELSRLTGRPVEALNHVMRTLRTSGHVQPGRKGFGYPVEAKSTASMLMACLSGARPAECPRAVEVFSGLRPKIKGGFGKGFPSLEYVAKADTFGQALEELLLLAPRLKAEAIVLVAVLFERIPTEQLLDLEFFQVELTLQSRPAPYAKLTLQAVNERGFYSHEFSQEWIVDGAKFMAGYYRPEMAGRSDLRVQTSITHKSLFRLGDLLAADHEEESHHEATRTEGAAGAQGRGDAATADQGRGRGTRSYGYGESGLRLVES